MDVILLEKVDNLGGLGDQVKVKAGYGRNYLLPSGKAIPATEDNIKEFESRRAELERAASDTLAVAQRRKETLEQLGSVLIVAKAGDEGKLFGSINIANIADAVCEAGVPVEKREVRMPSGPLRAVGEYEVDFHLHSDVNATLRVVIEAE